MTQKSFSGYEAQNHRFVHFELKPFTKCNTASMRYVKLAWQDNSANELGFKIERKTGSGGTYSEIATVGPNVTSCKDTGLSPATTCFYSVRAYNSTGYSSYSSEVSVKTSAN